MTWRRLLAFFLLLGVIAFAAGVFTARMAMPMAPTNLVAE